MGQRYSKQDLSLLEEEDYIKSRIVQKYGEPYPVNDSYIILNEMDRESFAPPCPSVDWRIEKEKVRREYADIHRM